MAEVNKFSVFNTKKFNDDDAHKSVYATIEEFKSVYTSPIYGNKYKVFITRTVLGNRQIGLVLMIRQK